MLVACNTASARLEDAPDVRRRAQELHVDITSMVDLLDIALDKHAVNGERVCLMGTEYTVNSPAYADRIERAGVASLVRLAATRTERCVAHLQHETAAGRELIRDEISDSIRDSGTVVLACTCFPLVGELIADINPDARLVDPGAETREVADWPEREGPSHLTLAFTGNAITRAELQAQATSLFPGWDEIEIVSLAD
jgi:glutamate racemase